MKFDPKKTVFLIDGSNFLYRSYYGMRPLHTATGEPIQAVYNFCRMLKKLIDTYQPRYLALVWDSPGKTERHEVYEEYKATRQEAPSDLFTQKERIVAFADMIGLAQVAESGIEADDLMFSIARDWEKKGNSAVFVTSDKDLGQALSDTVLLLDPFKEKLFDADAFSEKIGFPLSKFSFYMSLLGDTSDNIPGVRGIGKKGAAELVMQFDSLEDLYENLDTVAKPRTKTALEENRDNAFLSRDLFLLKYHKPKLTPDDLAFSVSQWPNAAPLFKELEFKSLLRDLGQPTSSDLTPEEKREKLSKYQFITVTTPEQLEELRAQLAQAESFALDTETDGVRPLQAELVGLSFCTQEDRAYYVPCGHKTDEPQLDRDQILETLRSVLEDPTIPKYLHNTKFDQLVLTRWGVELAGVAFDSMLAANLIKEEWQRVGLKALSEWYFKEQMLTFHDVVKSKKLPNFSHVPIDWATIYSGFDSLQTFRLSKLLMPKIKEEGMADLYYNMELPLSQVLYRMERAGIKLDAARLATLDKPVTRELALIEEQILGFVNGARLTINLNSPRQVQELLFEMLGLPHKKKSSKGTGYSTDQEVLQELAPLHPVPGLILKYRELAKLKSTYIDALPQYINPYTKRVHTTFSQIAVATGRLASSDPNLQNIPVSGASGFGQQVREAFIPKEGCQFISADYSQIELRVLAHLSGDKNLTNAFLHNHDIHAETAARLFDTDLDAVDHDQRQIGKRINFSILYGMTPYGLSKDLNIPLTDAKSYIEKYFAQYPGVSEWMAQVVETATKQGYVNTFWGRRRFVPAILEKNKVLYEEGKRVAINTVAQGTAAEIVKQGMITLDAQLRAQQIKARPLLQIHDELLIEARDSDVQKAAALTQKILESVVDWKVPLKVTTRIGANWKEVTK